MSLFCQEIAKDSLCRHSLSGWVYTVCIVVALCPRHWCLSAPCWLSCTHAYCSQVFRSSAGILSWSFLSSRPMHHLWVILDWNQTICWRDLTASLSMAHIYASQQLCLVQMEHAPSHLVHRSFDPALCPSLYHQWEWAVQTSDHSTPPPVTRHTQWISWIFGASNLHFGFSPD